MTSSLKHSGLTDRTKRTNQNDMKSVNVHEAKTQLSMLLAEIEERGERIVICRNGEPVADLVPHRRKVSMAPDAKLGAFVIGYDPTEELTDEEWPGDAR